MNKNKLFNDLTLEVQENVSGGFRCATPCLPKPVIRCGTGSFPKVNFPKVDFPKVDFPKVNFPKVNFPKPPVAKCPKPGVKKSVC